MRDLRPIYYHSDRERNQGRENYNKRKQKKCKKSEKVVLVTVLYGF